MYTLLIFTSFHLKAMITHSNTLKTFEKDTEMKILNIDEQRIVKEPGSTNLRLTNSDYDKAPNIPSFPAETYELTYDPWVTGERSLLRKAYNTSASCALYSAPFNTIRVNIANGVAKPQTNMQGNYLAVSDNDLYSAVIDSVRRPAAIVEAARSFKDVVFNGESYVAVHWRYDMQDWGMDRCKPDNPNKYSKMCEELRKIIPEDVAAGIAGELDKAKVNRSLWGYVYIASPPILREFADQVVSALRKINKYVQDTKLPLDSFISERYRPCWENGGWKNEKEIFSLIEMEILSQSEWFFFAPGSTFSSNVRPLRWKVKPNGSAVRKFETAAYDAARNAMIKRTGAQAKNKS